jgi:hypothetical protein
MIDGFDWIREIIPTHYYDNEEEINEIINRVRMEMGGPIIEMDINVEETSSLWEEADEMLKTILGDNYDFNKVEIKHWRGRYTVELCKEIICFHTRMRPREINGLILDEMAMLENIRREKQLLRETLINYGQLFYQSL